MSRLDQQQPMESPRFVRKNFFRNSTTTTTTSTAIDPVQSTYGQIATKSNSPRWQQQQNNDQTTMADDDSNEPFEWIEIFEPKSRTKMFANLTT